MLILEILLVAAGALLSLGTLNLAIRTVVVPRADQSVLNRMLFIVLRSLFDLVTRRLRTYEARDRMMARFAPVMLMTMPLLWASGVVLGFAAMFWGFGVRPVRDAVVLSGSSLTTLGFRSTDDLPTLVLAVLEALIGLGLIALLISFLPTMYGHFSRREVLVSKLFIRAQLDRRGAAPAHLLIRQQRIGGLENMDRLWTEWEDWFVEIEESHTSFPALNLFRSPRADRSWITAAGMALDGAALHLACVRGSPAPRAALMVRTGFEALRQIADFFGLPYDPDPDPESPISIRRDEFDDVWNQFAEAGMPLVDDIDEAWRSFVGWRVNYDAVLLDLSQLTMAPAAVWPTDRPARRTVRATLRPRRKANDSP